MDTVTRDRRLLFYGSAGPLPEQIQLRAGPLHMAFESGGLRYVRLGNELVLLRVYWAVRDGNWGTVPAQISHLRIDAREDAFDVRYAARCVNTQHGIDFRAEVTIAGAADGSLRFEMKGEAHSDFLRNRIGFCVLHPASQAGYACEIEHVDGTAEMAKLPKFIVGAQPLLPFAELRGLRVHVKGGAVADMRFEGDTFEMEDQRNWTDASFKTFCTPLRLPYPVQVKKGDDVQQAVRVKIEGAPATKRESWKPRPITFTIGTAGQPLPALGLGQAHAGKPLGARQIARLKALKLHHLRVDLDLNGKWQRELRRAAQDANALGAKLEVALFVDPENAYAQLDALRRQFEALRPKISHWLIFPQTGSQIEAPAIADLVGAARERLAHYNRKAIFAAGTDADFIFASKQAQAFRGIDAFCTPTNPQTHAFDNASLVESLAAQGTLVQSAARLAKGKPVIVSPVTLKPRWNPYSTAGATKVEPPSDPRQASLFGAGWTLGSIKYLAEAGAASVTYFETAGVRGVMARDVFPMWHVFASIGDFAGGDLITAKSSEPLHVDGLVLRKGRRARVLLANFTGQPQGVSLRGLAGKAKVKRLDGDSVTQAMKQPEAWHAEAGERMDASRITLPPFAIARIDYSY
jgi:hypothetical protein